MTYRCIPCQECRKRRRKCIRNSIYDICDRCRRLERECIYSDEEAEFEQHDQSLLRLQEQVESLNFLLKNMENQIQGLSHHNSNTNNTNDHGNDNNKQMTTKNSVYGDSNNISNNNKLWKLSFHNGTLRIETGIRSISDLLMQCLPIQYLSPLHTSEDETESIIQFDSGNIIRFLPLTIKLMVKCISPSSRPTSPPLLLPPTFDENAVAEKLISIYFQCRNKYKPLIHEKTFMQHYRALKSPLDSLICLSICCSVSTTPCNHFPDDPYKSRQLGDFFYSLAKAKLLNQFDETNKRLENLIAINLLNDYMLSALKLDDYKNLVKIGCRICLDLESWYESTKHEGNTVERILYSRHFLIIFFNQGLLSLITNEPLNHISMLHPEWLLMDEEPPEATNFVIITNHLIRLYNDPYLANIQFRAHFLLKGAPFSLTFESIIRMGDVLKDWWRSIPEKYRICDDWLDLTETKAAIDRCEDDDDLMLFNAFIAYMIDVYSALLNASKNNNDQALSVVQELALRRSLDCCQLLIHSQFKTLVLGNTVACHSVLNISENLFRSVDALIAMVPSTNPTVQSAAKDMLAKAQIMINHVRFMQYHRIDPLHSPLLACARVNDINSIDLSKYFSYPQPWLAMVYDLSHHLDKIQSVNGVPFLVESL